MIDQYRVEKYFIDLFFPVHNLGVGIEIDENGHTERSEIKEKQIEETIKNAGIILIRINPDKEGFDMDVEISEIQDFIYESGVKLGEQLKKNKMVEDLERSLKIVKLSG